MLFKPDPSLPRLPVIPDTVPLCDFMFDERYGRCPISESLDAYTCGISGRSISAYDQGLRVDFLSRALARELGWQVNHGSELDKAVGIFAYNTVDIMTVSWAIHRLNGVSSPANAMYNAEELRYQLETSRCKALFTVRALLPVAVEAANAAGIPNSKIFLCEMPGDSDYETGAEFRTLAELVIRGKEQHMIEPIAWKQGQGARQTAFLCYSSGTSGLPKAVKISHKNVIANIIQLSLFDKHDRDNISPGHRDVGLGLLPQSHIYSLIIICHASTYRGDSVIVLPKFDLKTYLGAIQKYRINTLYVVPPIVISMINNFDAMSRYDLASVKRVWVGAAPLAPEVTSALTAKYPSWTVTLGYGMTETCVVVTSGTPRDVVLGSSGWLLPGFEVLLVDENGNKITSYEQPGEVLVKSPSVVLGYAGNEAANQETFLELPEGRFVKTGDIGEFRKTPSGSEHLWIVDRLKELIKVKGHQVAPAELEDCLLGHPEVSDCAVIASPDARAGEVPKAFVVRSGACTEGELQRYVETRKAPHKWIKGGIEFVDSIPKSPSGKILRRLLRNAEVQKRKAKL